MDREIHEIRKTKIPELFSGIFAECGRRILGSPTNCCLSGCAQNYLSLRASAHTGVAIPRLEGKCAENHPKIMGTPAIFGGNRYLIPFNRGIATT
ncbi:MAG: hypothetical protein SPE19_07760, partial [Candidatus Faecousia sp.]|nr:hypothetical protein [Candidatus Faecousia sp.]